MHQETFQYDTWLKTAKPRPYAFGWWFVWLSCSHLSSASHGSPELEKLKLKDSELERGAWIRSSREKRPMDMKENLRELAAAIVFVYLDSGENGGAHWDSGRWLSYYLLGHQLSVRRDQPPFLCSLFFLERSVVEFSYFTLRSMCNIKFTLRIVFSHFSYISCA